ncbi:protein of unknown function [Burkholderia multivorans]
MFSGMKVPVFSCYANARTQSEIS